MAQQQNKSLFQDDDSEDEKPKVEIIQNNKTDLNKQKSGWQSTIVANNSDSDNSSGGDLFRETEMARKQSKAAS